MENNLFRVNMLRDVVWSSLIYWCCPLGFLGVFLTNEISLFSVSQIRKGSKERQIASVRGCNKEGVILYIAGGRQSLSMCLA